MAELRVRFSRAAPPTWREMWRDKMPVDVSKWICRLTHSPFSHVDLVLEDGNLLGASDNPYAPVIDGNPRGVAIRPPEYQRFAVRRDAVIQTTHQKKWAFENFARDQLGMPYDNEAIKPSVFFSAEFANREWRTPGEWYCAEMYGRATEVSDLLGYPIPGIKNRITPPDLILLWAPLFDFEVCRLPIPGLKLQPGEV